MVSCTPRSADFPAAKSIQRAVQCGRHAVHNSKQLSEAIVSGKRPVHAGCEGAIATRHRAATKQGVVVTRTQTPRSQPPPAPPRPTNHIALLERLEEDGRGRLPFRHGRRRRLGRDDAGGGGGGGEEAHFLLRKINLRKIDDGRRDAMRS
jgi:hypothetical protein